MSGVESEGRSAVDREGVTDRGLSTIDGEWTLTALGVDNLRALRMDAPIELRRLLLVVGRNGVGKSTLARVFPLLRQSAGTRTREPLLWWERDQVDFGSFSDACRRGESEMTFTFRFADRGGAQFEVSSVLASGPEGSRVARVLYQSKGDRCALSFDERGVLSGMAGRLEGEPVVPPAWVTERMPGVSSQPWQLFGIPEHVDSPYDVMGMLAAALDLFATESVRLVERLPWRSRAELEAGLVNPPYARVLDGKQVEELLETSGWTRALQEALFSRHVFQRLKRAEELVEQLAQRAAYLGPFRAMPERSYRHQSVAVEQLDPRGANLAMFVSALEDRERRSLNAFLSKWLNFKVYARRAGAQYALEIGTDEQRYNLLDVGFGYSQVLPVAVQLWVSTRPTLSMSRTTERLAVMVVEQPELHLHPHHQVLVAQAMGAAAMADDGPIQVVETHSDHLVGEIGLMIAGGRLDPARVGVICVEPHESGDGATVRMATFDEDGLLHDWPAGFMTP